MVVHMVLLAVPAAAAGGLMHAFKYSILLWPFNLARPLLRDLPRVCAALRSPAAYYAAELRAYLTGNRRNSYSSIRGVQGRPREQLVALGMSALLDITY